MSFLRVLLLFFIFGKVTAAEYTIVYVHIGERLPSYLNDSIEQARLFNPDCPIVLIANEIAVKNFFSDSHVSIITCESLTVTSEHQMFQKRTKLNQTVMDGFWRYTSERFLYLYDWMATNEIENVFHLENDVMLYVNLEELLPVFQKFYPGIAATFENDSKCIPGFVYVGNNTAMQKLAHCFAKYATKALTDMKLLAVFRKEQKKDVIDCLPLIMESYVMEKGSSRKLPFCNHVNEFHSLFDGAAIGVHLDGMDPCKGPFPVGYKMKSLFDPSLLTYEWIDDEAGRRIPYATYGTETYRINNLHIASKRLHLFNSL